MTEKEINILLRKGEGLTSEFKSSFNNEVLETLVAFANTAVEDVPKDVPKDVPIERRDYILVLINDNKKVTISELAGLCQVSMKTIKRDIEYLKTAKLLKRIGGRKSGQWVITHERR